MLKNSYEDAVKFAVENLAPDYHSEKGPTKLLSWMDDLAMLLSYIYTVDVDIAAEKIHRLVCNTQGIPIED